MAGVRRQTLAAAGVDALPETEAARPPRLVGTNGAGRAVTVATELDFLPLAVTKRQRLAATLCTAF